MRHNTTATLLAIAALAAATAFGAYAAAGQKGEGDLPELDELKRTYQLAPGANVEVSSISGSVEIETSDTATAEVRVIRTARSRTDLAYRNVVVERQASGLVVRGEHELEGAVPRGVEVRHRVLLRIPRKVALTVKNISGPVTVGNIDGPIQLDNISGAARLGNVRGPLAVTNISGPLTIGNVSHQVQLQNISGRLTIGNVSHQVQLQNISGNVMLGGAIGHLELREVSGDVTATMAGLDRRGILVSKVSGAIELRFADALNADVVASGIDGKVLLDVPGVVLQSTLERTTLRARVGTGGPPISIVEVSGSVRLVRLT